MGGSTEDPAQDVTFSGRTVKWQGVPVRRCALGRITVKANTKDKSVRARERLRGPHRGVFRRDGKGSRRRYGHRLYTGCIRPPSVRTNPIADFFHFCVMTLFIGALKEIFPAVRQGSEVSWFRLVLRRRTPTIVAARVPPQSTDR